MEANKCQNCNGGGAVYLGAEPDECRKCCGTGKTPNGGGSNQKTLEELVDLVESQLKALDLVKWELDQAKWELEKIANRLKPVRKMLSR